MPRIYTKNPNVKSKKPLYTVWKDISKKGTRCEEWKDFTKFEDWAKDKYKKGFCLTSSETEYGPNTCTFVNRKDLMKKVDHKLAYEKRKQTFLEKYGVDHNSKTKNFRENARKKCVLTKPENIKKRLDGQVKAGTVKLYDGKPIAQLYRENLTSKCRLTFTKHFYEGGLENAIEKPKNVSSLPDKVCSFLTSLNIQYEREKNFDKKKSDICIESNKLIIECDGLFWHSDGGKKNDSYHVERRLFFLNKGYFPLFFREDELRDKFNIITSIIKNRLGLSNKIYARKCDIQEISTPISKIFFETNHLMGAGNGKTLGLVYDNELVASIRIVKKKTHTEVSRFCTKLGYNIIGGLSKLLSRIDDNIVSFVDLRYGNGNSLINLGFNMESCHKSFKWTDGKNTFHRMSFKSNSGYENGLYKIWDCGQAKFVKKRTTS